MLRTLQLGVEEDGQWLGSSTPPAPTHPLDKMQGYIAESFQYSTALK